MPIDPTIQAASMLTNPRELSLIEQQNRFGNRHQTISGLTPNKHLTILAIETPAAFSSEQFFEILDWLRQVHGVENIQTVFAAVVPDFGQEYRCDLHLTAHLRAESGTPPAVSAS